MFLLPPLLVHKHSSGEADGGKRGADTHEEARVSLRHVTKYCGGKHALSARFSAFGCWPYSEGKGTGAQAGCIQAGRHACFRPLPAGSKPLIATGISALTSSTFFPPALTAHLASHLADLHQAIPSASPVLPAHPAPAFLSCPSCCPQALEPSTKEPGPC